MLSVGESRGSPSPREGDGGRAYVPSGAFRPCAPTQALPRRGRETAGAGGGASTTLRWLLAGAVAASLVACAGRVTLHGAIDALYAGQVTAADVTLAQYGKKVRGNDWLLYLLNAGVVKQVIGDYRESNRLLAAAEERVEVLLTRSVSRETASFLVNDQTRAYAGAAYEQALINYYKAVNYLLLGEVGEAVVECRRLDVRLGDLAGRIGTAGLFGEEAFLRYFTGVIYEAAGEAPDAMVAYRNALALYGKGGAMPPDVPAAAVRLARHLGFADEVAAVLGAFPLAADAPVAAATVVVVVDAGRVPYKVSESVIIPTPHGFPARLSLPRLTGGSGGRRAVAVTVGEVRDTAYPVEDVAAVAGRELDDRRGRDLARLVARAVAKELAAQEARRKGGDVAEVLVRVANIATEVADTRSWESLPAQIYLARLPVVAGAATLEVAVDGRRIAQEPLEIHDGTTVFRKYRVF